MVTRREVNMRFGKYRDEFVDLLAFERAAVIPCLAFAQSANFTQN